MSDPHAGHNHAGHDHAAHDDDDHAGHDHAAHDHEDHAGHDHAGGGHDHAGHSHGIGRATQRRALWIALVLNGGFLFVEVAGGLAFHSLALLADAAHMVSDVASLAIALVAQRLIDRPASTRYSFGFQRAEVLGAQANGFSLLLVSGWIVYEAITRIGGESDVVGGGLLVVATIGLLINVGSAVYLVRAQGESLNMRGASLHMMVDAAGSVAAITAGIAVILWQANWVDPAMSMLIAALVLWSAWGLVRDTSRVFLEGAPRGIDPLAVEAALVADEEVQAVHHMHLWNLASDVPSLSAHVVLDEEQTLHSAQEHGERLKALLAQQFGIEHSTLELECHPCDVAPDELSRSDAHRSRH